MFPARSVTVSVTFCTVPAWAQVKVLGLRLRVGAPQLSELPALISVALICSVSSPEGLTNRVVA